MRISLSTSHSLISDCCRPCSLRTAGGFLFSHGSLCLQVQVFRILCKNSRHKWSCTISQNFFRYPLGCDIKSLNIFFCYIPCTISPAVASLWLHPCFPVHQRPALIAMSLPSVFYFFFWTLRFLSLPFDPFLEVPPGFARCSVSGSDTSYCSVLEHTLKSLYPPSQS